MSSPLSPFVFHIPHSSRIIPDDVRPTLLLSDAALRSELIAMTDSHTEALFGFDPVGRSIIFPVSRLVVDPERYLDDALEPMAARGMGVIYTTTSTGRSLRSITSAEGRRALLDRFYTPHHRALEVAVDAALSEHSLCTLIDCHSFPSTPRAHELDPMTDRPDICLGTDAFHTPGWLHGAVGAAFRSRGLSVTLDRPYAGSMVPLRHYGRTKEVYSLMIEVNRRLYMDEVSGERLPEFPHVADMIGAALRALAADVGERVGRDPGTPAGSSVLTGDTARQHDSPDDVQ